MFAGAAAGRTADDGDRPPPAAAALDRVAARHRQYPPAGRADADRDAVARPWACAARHRDRDRRQSASRVHRGAAGQGAVVLLPRYPGSRRRAASTRSCTRRRRAPRSNACRCCAAASSRRTASRPTISSPRAGSRWVLRGDRGITYATAVPAGSRMVAGQWWSADYSGEPLVSLESKTAHDLDLKIGDTITVNVLGRNITARIANLRAVDWENLGINFVLVFSPGAFAGAPHTDIATLTFADGGTPAEETALIKALADAFPTVTAVRVKDALDTLDALVGNLVAGAARRERDHADCRGAGARRRARRQPAVPHLRRGGAEDARRDARRGCLPPMRWNISSIGAGRRRVRRRRGLARRRPDGDAGDGFSLRLRAGRRPRGAALWRCSSRSCSGLPALLRRSAASPRRCSGIFRRCARS